MKIFLQQLRSSNIYWIGVYFFHILLGLFLLRVTKEPITNVNILGMLSMVAIFAVIYHGISLFFALQE